ncbi:MAG TPA: hypothetical protein VFT65_11295 [Candidatus Angelobacter sp.]|nr:hypothetical protein [Candidatus Angelobacter sp.]
MQSIYRLLAAVAVLGAGFTGTAQQANVKKPVKTQAVAQKAAPKLSAEQKFVLDTVKMAVDLPQSDQQDRLRVLSAAADVVSTIDKKMARSLWSEGVRIESELIQVGQTPAVSMMSSGQADCAAAQSFVENLPPAAALRAEQSLIGAVTACPKQTLDPVSRKLDAAMDKGVIPSRAIMATMQAQGESTTWSQEHFAKMFSSLPDPQSNASEAENFAAMYAQGVPAMKKDAAAAAGLKLLDWLGKLDGNPLRGLSIRVTTGAMEQALGAEAYQKALQSDLVASSVAQNAGQDTEIQRPPQESVSVLEAMDNKGTDQSERLRGLPPTTRAREAAANGFAAGTSGNKQQARKYFDMAFSAADEVWDARSPDVNAVAVVQEISEAAAQVDSVNALTRAQKLHDSSAQAIAMLAVARVVASNGVTK